MPVAIVTGINFFTMTKYLLLLIVLAGCLTPKHADKKLAQIGKKYPDMLAKISRDSFPCTTTYADTITLTQDTLILIECPDATDYEDKTIVVHDTIKNNPQAPRKTHTVYVNVPNKTVFITKTIEDSAKIKLLTTQALKDDKEIASLTKKLSRRTHAMWWLYGVTATLTAFIYLLLRRKK